MLIKINLIFFYIYIIRTNNILLNIMGAQVWLNNRWVLYNEYQILELELKKFPEDIQRIILNFY